MENDQNKQQKVEFDFYLTKKQTKDIVFQIKWAVFIFLQLNALKIESTVTQLWLW